MLMIDARISDIFIYRTASASSQTFLLTFVYQEKLSALNVSSTRRCKNKKKLLISTAGRSLTLSGKNKVCEINPSCFCMDKNKLIWLLSCLLFDLWDIYTSNVSTLQQPLFLVGAGSSEHRLDTWREKIRQNRSDHPSSRWRTVLQNSRSKVATEGTFSCAMKDTTGE